MKKKSESLKTFSLPSVEGVEVISGTDILNEFRRHIHKTYIIGLITDGKRIINCSGSSEQISKNEIFIINPGQVHSCITEDSGHSYKILSITPITMQSIASQISEKNENMPYFSILHHRNKKMCRKAEKLFETIENREPDMGIESSLYSFLTFLIINFSDNPPLIHGTGDQRESVKRACNYIAHNFPENITLKKLAEIACLSPFHFQREFKKNIGITPQEYLSDFRISQSKKLLLKSKDIADVAIQSGFFDQSHFSRIFRRTVGISPGKYLKNNK